MIGLLGCYGFTSNTRVDIQPMLSDLPKSLVSEKFLEPSIALCRLGHGVGRSGSIAEDADFKVFVSGEIFDSGSTEGLDINLDNAASIILSLSQIRRLDQLASVNGQFCALVYQKSTHCLSLITDRLATFPIHYWKGLNEIVFSTNLATLIAHPKVPCKADSSAVAQLFTMQRTIGQTTPLANVKSVPAATIIKFNSSDEKRTEYWKLEWRKPNFSYRDGADLLADALTNALLRQTEGEGLGLLLSGGLDSRAVLAAAPNARVSSWTTASYQMNPELLIAQNVAKHFNSEHTALIIQPEDTLAVLDRTVIESGGMYPASTPMSAFLPQVGAHCKTILSGHGLDYTFRGYYLPSRFIDIAGSRTRLPILRPIPKNPTALDVLNTLRQGPPKATIDKIIRSEKRQSWWDGLQDNIEIVLNPWLRSDEPYNAWDAFILHAVSKHYAFTGMMAVRAVCDLRLPAFDNEVFDIFLRMPPAWRCSGRMMQLALAKLSQKACQIPNANTGFYLGMHPWIEVAMLLSRGLMRRMGVLQRPAKPSKYHSTGSWQNLTELYRTESGHRTHFTKMINRLDGLSLGIFEHDEMRKCIVDHLEGHATHTKLLRQLLTHDSWIRNFNIDTTSGAV